MKEIQTNFGDILHLDEDKGDEMLLDMIININDIVDSDKDESATNQIEV